MALRFKRIYDQPEPGDGKRYLVDRIWPRGVSKARAALDAWLKDLSPSNELCKWFGHDPARWEEFKKRYQQELKAEDKKSRLKELAMEARKKDVTLLYAAKDTEHNNAVALREAILRNS